MMIRLEVPEGPEKEITPHTYHQEKVRIGRAETNDITLTEEGVSPFHATLEVKDGQGRLIPGMDEGLLCVNGTPVKGATLLQPGDRLTLGTVEIGYKLVPFPVPEKYRKRSWLEWATLGLLVGGVLGQIYFLLIPSTSLRDEIEPQRLIPTPTPVPLPTPDPSLVEPTPTPTPLPLVVAPGIEPEPTPTPEPDAAAPTADSAVLVEEAKQLLADDQMLDAERTLRQALRGDPGYLPAKVALARLLSDQSNFEESLRFWQQIRREAPAGSLVAMDARLEIPSLERKIARLEEGGSSAPRSLDAIPVPTQAPFQSTFPTPSVPVIQQALPLEVENIRMERYAESPRYDEFRILTFDLVHVPETPAVEAGTIKVRVTFFEQVGSRIRQADIPNPRIVLDVEEGLARSQRREELSAAYEVPTGRSADGRSYYGAILEVFVEGKEVHRSAEPAFLLDFVR